LGPKGKKNRGKKEKTTDVAVEATAAVADGTVAEMDAPSETIASDDTVVTEVAIPEESADALAEGADAMPPEQLELVIESLLFASDKPLTAGDCRRIIGGRSDKPIAAAIESLRIRREDTGIQLIESAAGWRLQTHPGNHEWVGRLMTGRAMRLSRALMETLAIVAYRQPITRPEIDDIRGVDCGGVLKTLLDRNLVRVLGKAEDVGRPILYGTTPDFLRIFNIKELAELPTLRDFHELGEEEQAKVDSTHPGGTPEQQVEAAGPVKAFAFDAVQAGEENDELLEEIDDATAAAARAVTEFEEATANPDAVAAASNDS
jgi:segregation and condensation protein B